MSEYLPLLEYYGYKVYEVVYDDWKEELENYVSAGGRKKDLEQHALLPLYHVYVNDLQANTNSPELDDHNSVGYGVGRDDVGRYLRYLADIGFEGWPTGKGRASLELPLTREQLNAVGAVGGLGGAK
ncbi:large subunit of alpha-aminoadipate reductase [Conoideocrella luteorostrata]|uniref:Large subunit of alpha-aminoadipate reductase n=1 Tax=Conoideocrella luteorostrata TaxID=1105319 RepID=A0AAJ0CNY7_9HYPO|nr:large subunit of alpha-aminoadipate reductase [Conoideocrella luteorostrata]